MDNVLTDLTLGLPAFNSSSVDAQSKKKSTTHASSVAGTLRIAKQFSAARKRARHASERPTTKAKKTPKELPETRLAHYIAFPCAATRDRITRAFQHRLYLIDKRLSEDPNSPPSCSFNILGATGNVYEVKLQHLPECSCPDFPRSGLCKHILFVMLRVLKLDRDDPRVWQRALLTSELRQILTFSVVSNDALASNIVRQRFHEIQGVGKENAPPQPQQREITGDCPICCERMDDGKGKAKEPVVFCRSCGNNVHKDCFEKWDRRKTCTSCQTTCLYCRALWSEDSLEESDYVNLADVSAVHRDQNVEDLYPEWTRRGKRWRRRRSGSY